MIDEMTDFVEWLQAPGWEISADGMGATGPGPRHVAWFGRAISTQSERDEELRFLSEDWWP